MNGSRFNYEDYAYEAPAEPTGDYFLSTAAPVTAAPPRLAPDIHSRPAEGVLHRPVGELIADSVLSKPVGELIADSVLSKPVSEVFRRRRSAG